MLKGIDWQMVGFLGVSLFQDYIAYVQLPKIYYWEFENSFDDNGKKIA